MGIFRNQTLTGQRVVLDGNVYDNCKLIDCEIVYRGGNVEFDFDTKRCRWTFEGSAFNTIQMLQRLGMVPSGDDFTAALLTDRDETREN